MMAPLHQTFNRAVLKRFAKCERGAAAIEFAFIGGFMCVAMLNTADLTVYFFNRMQVQTATEMGVQAAWKTCDQTMLPATTKCPNLATAVTTAIQSTSLGNAITLVTSPPTEGYYCVTGSNILQYVSDVSTKPADCTAAGVPTATPGDYISVQTSFPYKPLFPGLTVTSTLPNTITRTAWIRLG